MEKQGNNNNLYAYDVVKVDSVRAQMPWSVDPKWFKRVKVSPSATIKMMMHGQSGVDKGIKKNGKPVEVMGILIGRPDTEDPHALIISDAYALPIEGFETSVVADNIEVQNFQIQLGDMVELTRLEQFCGWYHTHPFDVDVNSHCFFSNTDISTQLNWQMSEDRNGNPFLGIVIDPLRSLAKGRPEMAAFRAYPPGFAPPLNETPDGTFCADKKTNEEKWGASWSSYYKMEMDYFMSPLAQSTLGILKNNFLWQNSFTSTPMLEPDHQQRLAERVGAVAKQLDSVGLNSMRSMGGEEAMAGGSGGDAPQREEGISKIAQTGGELAAEQCKGCAAQLAKLKMFGQAWKHMRHSTSTSSSSISSSSLAQGAPASAPASASASTSASASVSAPSPTVEADAATAPSMQTE